METMIISIKNEKAKQLLTDLAELDLIEIKSEQEVIVNKLSQLRNKIVSKMGETAIDSQLQQLRNEWQRSI